MTQLGSKQRYPCIKDIVDRRQRDLASPQSVRDELCNAVTTDRQFVLMSRQPQLSEHT
jgi:hypothetical protein